MDDRSSASLDSTGQLQCSAWDGRRMTVPQAAQECAVQRGRGSVNASYFSFGIGRRARVVRGGLLGWVHVPGTCT